MGCTSPEIRRLIVKARRNGNRVKDIAEMFNVSRWTVWRWTKRAHHRGGESYRDRSRRPHTIHRKITKDVENVIIVLRDSFKWGTHRIMIALENPPEYIQHLFLSIIGKKWEPLKLSRQSVNNVLRKHHRNGFPPGGKREWKFFRAEGPNALWQMDIKGPFRIEGRAMLALIIIDDYSRYLISCRLFRSIATEHVTGELSDCIEKHGTPRKILVNHGPQFKERFLDWCTRRGIEVIYAPPRYPQAKGKVERSIRTFNEEFLVLGTVFENHIALMDEYEQWFNRERYHLGICDYPVNLYPQSDVADLT
jgi:transposase InsO family protein